MDARTQKIAHPVLVFFLAEYLQHKNSETSTTSVGRCMIINHAMSDGDNINCAIRGTGMCGNKLQ